MTITIHEVAYGSEAYQNILTLRTEILRKPLGLELSDEDVATEDREFHIAAFDGEEVVGCVLLRPVDKSVVKLRQMAVSSKKQGVGLGAKLVIFAENLARARGFNKVETHARVVAQGFYEKLGYQVSGGVFTEVTVATIKMTKEI
jgi:N-acetylglutamate synthase-like GNAT family acetyltransferase